MDSSQQIIKKIEQVFQISFNENNRNTYDMDNGVISKLSITDVHFEKIDVLSPLFGTVKKLEIECGRTLNEQNLAENIIKFEALEELSVSTTSIKTARDILSMENLTELTVFISLDPQVHPKETFDLNVMALRNVQSLSLSCIIGAEHNDNKFIFEGAEHLKNLKELTLECNCKLEIEGLDRLKQLNKLTLFDVDVRSIPNIESLKTLYCSHYIDEFNCEGKFTNLENLKIELFSSIIIGQLNKLRILVMDALNFDLENASCFDHLPNLEQLSLTRCDISKINKIGQLKNLKMLDLSENIELVNIEELEGLKRLERLNLFDNKISDIRVLNKLPNLKQVDLACNKIGEEEVVNQLDNPEIACFMGRPHVPFIIGGWETF